MTIRFHCADCGQTLEGVPSFGTDAPFSHEQVPASQRAARCDLGSDDCVIDGKLFFVRGCLEVPVLGEAEPLSWGVWVSLSEASHRQWIATFDLDRRSHVGPFFGWLNVRIGMHPNTVNLRTRVHLRDHGLRPLIELEPTDHPLAREQREGITPERVVEIHRAILHEGS